MLLVVLFLLFPAIVEHAGDEEVEWDANEEHKNDNGEDTLVQGVPAVLNVVVKVILELVVISALVVQPLLHLVRVHRHDDDDDKSGDDP